MEYTKWTKEKIIEDLKYYQENNYTVSELKRHNSKLCGATLRYKIPHNLRKAKKKLKWTKEKIIEELVYYQENNYSEHNLRLKDPRLYTACKNNGIETNLKETKIWSKEKITKDLKFYQENNYSLSQLKKENSNLLHNSYKYKVPHGLSLKPKGRKGLNLYKTYKDQETILYYCKVEKYGKSAYKFGVTKSSIVERYSRENKYDSFKIEIIYQKVYKDGMQAIKKEKEIYEETIDFLYVGKPILEGGNTELRDRDIIDYFPIDL